MAQYLSKTLVQGFIVLLAVTLIMIIVKLNLSDGFEWQISKIGIYAFIVVNQFAGLRLNDWKNYSIMSLLILFALSIDLIILATLFSGIQINELQYTIGSFLLPLLSFPIAVVIFQSAKKFIRINRD